MFKLNQIDLFDLLTEITQTLAFNPQPEALAEFANKVLGDKIVLVSVGGDDPDEVRFEMVATEGNRIQ